MGVMTRAVRNLSRRKIRAMLVVVALGFCMSIIVALPPGIAANQAAAENLTASLSDLITKTEAAINQTLTQIDVSLTAGTVGGTGGGPVVKGPNDPPGGLAGKGYGAGSLSGGKLEPMNETDYADIADLSNVAAVVPVFQMVEGSPTTKTLYVGGVPQVYDVTVPEYIITGVPLDASLIDNYPILPTTIVDGRNLQASETGVVILSQNCSEYFKAGVGDTVNILGIDFSVVGIFEPVGASDTLFLYMSLEDAQRITDSEEIVTSLKVFAANSDVVSSVANDIYELHPELNINTAQERLSQISQVKSVYNTQLANAQAIIGQTEAQARGITLLAVSATSVIVLFVMLYTVRERTKEIGTLKAIGASNGTIMSQFLVEGILLSAFAGLVGVAIGAVAAPVISSILLPPVSTPGGAAMAASNTQTAVSTFSITPELILIGLGVSVLLGAIGSLYPAWRAAKIRPAEAMRYE